MSNRLHYEEQRALIDAMFARYSRCAARRMLLERRVERLVRLLRMMQQQIADLAAKDEK